VRIDPNTRRAAAETAHLAAAFGSEDAANMAIGAAAARQDRVVLERVIAQAETAAENVTGELDPEVAYILRWFADQLRKDLPADDNSGGYSPGDGDCVQVTITGLLNSYEVSHPSMPRPETVWELVSAEGLMLPLTEEDFDRLGVVRLLCGE
jgi:hypothetical protein